MSKELRNRISSSSMNSSLNNAFKEFTRQASKILALGPRLLEKKASRPSTPQATSVIAGIELDTSKFPIVLGIVLQISTENQNFRRNIFYEFHEEIYKPSDAASAIQDGLNNLNRDYPEYNPELLILHQKVWEKLGEHQLAWYVGKNSGIKSICVSMYEKESQYTEDEYKDIIQLLGGSQRFGEEGRDTCYRVICTYQSSNLFLRVSTSKDFRLIEAIDKLNELGYTDGLPTLVNDAINACRQFIDNGGFSSIP